MFDQKKLPQNLAEKALSIYTNTSVIVHVDCCGVTVKRDRLRIKNHADDATDEIFLLCHIPNE